ncbi:MAG: LacI family transcriptional regulator [Actinomycetota bacterium]|nr:LacI family transcriptional regulator [Actinomycetota bacterium]
MTGKRIGIKDVAAHAGVSQGTVSHVLNHPDRVRPERREAVEKAILELGFVRHESARQLRAGYSSTIGLLLLDAWNPSFQTMARGVEDAAEGAEMTLLISNSGRSLERESTYLRVFSEHRMAGAVVIPHDEYSQDLHQIRADGMPIVLLDRADTCPGVLSVGVDDVVGGRVAAEHLLGLGHRRLVFVGDESRAAPVHDRLAGVREAVARSGPEVSLEVIACELTGEAGREVGAGLATTPATRRPTGIVCAIDLLAIGILQGMHQHGVTAPDDLSIVGYDDIPFSAELSVPLTTVHRPHYEMGVAAVVLLRAAIRGEAFDRTHVAFTPELVVRSSSGPPPSRRTTTRRSASARPTARPSTKEPS